MIQYVESLIQRRYFILFLRSDKDLPVNRPIIVFFVVLLCSCKAYKQDIMFKFDDDFTQEELSTITNELDGNYLLKPNDILQLDVFTNKGERLIDPNFEMMAGQMGQQQQLIRDRFQYVIQANGMVTFPMIGDLNLGRDDVV